MVEELAEAYVNMDLATMEVFQQRATAKLMGVSASYEDMLLQGMGGGAGGGAAPTVLAATPPVAPAAGGAATADGAKPSTGKKVVEKLTVDVTMKKYPAENKIKLIKELRSVLNLSIAEAKAAVEKCPGVIAANVSKADAEKLQGLWKTLGAEVDLV